MTFEAHVELTLGSWSATPGATRTYWARVRTQDAADPSPWLSNTGFKAVNQATITWERSDTAPPSAAWDVVTGAYGPDAVDGWVAWDGVPRWYRAAVGAPGWTPAYSNADEGSSQNLYPSSPLTRGLELHDIQMQGGAGHGIGPDGTLAVWGSNAGPWYPGTPPFSPMDRLFVDTGSLDHEYRLTILDFEVAVTPGTTAPCYAGAGYMPWVKCNAVYSLVAAINNDCRINETVRARPEWHGYTAPAIVVEPRINGSAYTLTSSDAFLDVMRVAPAAGFVAVAGYGGGGVAITADFQLETWGSMRTVEGAGVASLPPSRFGGFDAVDCGSTGYCCAHMPYVMEGDRGLLCFTGYPGTGACGDDVCGASECGASPCAADPAFPGYCSFDCADEPAAWDEGDRPLQPDQRLPTSLHNLEIRDFAVGSSDSESCPVGCAIVDGTDPVTGELRCWYSGGEISYASDAFFDPIRDLHPTNAFAAVEVGYCDVCVLGGDGHVYCSWDGNPGTDTFANPGGVYSELALSENASYPIACALRASDGDVDCWGFPLEGFSPVPGGGPYVNVEAAHWAACAETATGRIDCWGTGYSGSAIPPHDRIVDVDLGANGLCLINADGRTQCPDMPAPPDTMWGCDTPPCPETPWRSFETNDFMCGISQTDPTSGDLEDLPDATCWPPAYATPPAGPWSLLAAANGNGQVACGVRSGVGPTEGTVECWGNFDWGGTRTPPPEISPPPAGHWYTALAIGGENACVLRDDGAVACWGATSTQVNSPIPTLGLGETWVQIALHADEACGRTSIGRLVCWGHSGGLVPAPTETGFLDMDLGYFDYLCAVRSTGETACYSPGSPAPIINSPWHSPLPGAGYVRIANDGSSVCAVRQDGTVACRGGYTR